tara:strand:- start:109 stop:264 length:156 start_codon:yes stop_codon:yes gene_type:complete
MRSPLRLALLVLTAMEVLVAVEVAAPIFLEIMATRTGFSSGESGCLSRELE